MLARAALEPAPGALGQSGRGDAIAAAAEFGFLARIEPLAPGRSGAEQTYAREADGQITVSTPSRRSAVMRSASTGTGSWKVRVKLPWPRSIR